jgi:hypothetical protein
MLRGPARCWFLIFCVSSFVILSSHALRSPEVAGLLLLLLTGNRREFGKV